MTKPKPRAAFLGIPRFLKLAYPENLRSELADHLSIDGEDIHFKNWRDSIGSLSEADVIFSTWKMPKMDEEFLAATPRLKAVFYAGGSVKEFATQDAFARGVRVSSAWEANAIPVAEFTLAAVILSLKRFWGYAKRTRETKSFGHDLPVAGAYKSRVGVLSLGAVGRRVAKKLSDLEVEVQAYDPFVDTQAARSLNVSLVPIGDLFLTSDVVTIHAPLLPETEGLVGEKLLASLKPGATIINTSRGAVINESDLCEVLQSRPDLTAILDVTHPEPPGPESPLFVLPNVVLTPHIAGSMGGEITRMGSWMVDEFSRFLLDRPLQREVSAEMLARMA